jgi:hypothetical protein
VTNFSLDCVHWESEFGDDRLEFEKWSLHWLLPLINVIPVIQAVAIGSCLVMNDRVRRLG